MTYIFILIIAFIISSYGFIQNLNIRCIKLRNIPKQLIGREVLMKNDDSSIKSLSDIDIIPSTQYKNHALWNGLRKSTKVLSIGLISSSLLWSNPSFAKIGEGDLPDGAMAFTKLMKYQKDWKALIDSLKIRTNPLDEREIVSLKFFLKQLSNEYYDMDLLSASILDKDNQSKAKSIAKEFRQTFRDLDKELDKDGISMSANNRLLDADSVVTKDFNEFFILLQDVPDEL